MVDPTSLGSQDTASSGDSNSHDDSNRMARSIVGRAQRLQRSLSPWVQRMLSSGSESTPLSESPTVARPTTIQRKAASVQRSPFSALNRPASVSGGLTLSLLNRVQRTTERGSVINERSQPRTGAALDRFATKLVQRFPDLTEKYQAKQQTDSPEVVQRASLPFAGDAASPEPVAPTPAILPGVDADLPTLDFPPISVSPQDSIASQLGARLQAYRQLEPPSGSSSEQTSPRQIGRKTLEAATSQRAKPGVIRRSTIEEFSSPPSLPETTSTPSGSPTVQRKPATPKRSTPAPRQPSSSPSTIQRSPVGFSTSPESEDPGPRPNLPSFSKQLINRLKEQRAEQAGEAAAAPASESPQPPTVQRRAADDSHVAEHREVRRPRIVSEAQPFVPPTIQRSPEPTAPPDSAAPEPPSVTSDDDLTLRRKPQTSQATPAPEVAKSEPAASNPTVALTPSELATTVQRKPVTNAPAASDEPSLTASAPELPLAQPRVQSQPAKPESSSEQGEPGPSLADASPQADTPAIQRKPEPDTEPTPSRPRPEMRAERVIQPPDSSAPVRSPAVSVAPTPVSSASASSVQRKLDEDLPLHASASPEPAAAETSGTTPAPSLSESVLARARSSESLPLSQPTPGIQRRAESTLPSIAASSDTPALRAAPEVAPFIQRKPENDLPLETGTTAPVTASAPTIQRGPEPAPESSSAITTRSAAVTTKPKSSAAKPLTLARTSASPAVLTQARIQREVDTDIEPIAPEATQSLTLAAPARAEAKTPTSITKPMGIVQRSTKSTTSTEPSVSVPPRKLPLASSTRVKDRIQRAESGSDDSQPSPTETESAKPKVDLHDVALRVYPLLKRMLAIERERRNR